jgi:hypothetical protein
MPVASARTFTTSFTLRRAERTFDPLLQLFIRYGRGLFSYRVITDDLGLFAIGQPFGPGVFRVLGVVRERSILATYNTRAGEGRAARPT